MFRYKSRCQYDEPKQVSRHCDRHHTLTTPIPTLGYDSLLGVNNLIFLLSICCLPQTTEHTWYHPIGTYLLWELTSLDMVNPMISMKNRANDWSLSDCEINQTQCEFMFHCGQTISTQQYQPLRCQPEWCIYIYTPLKTNMKSQHCNLYQYCYCFKCLSLAWDCFPKNQHRFPLNEALRVLSE